MDTKQAVMENLSALDPLQQREVLDFVEFLRHKKAKKRPLRSVEGLWADLGIDVTEEDIAEARREMGGGFPRGLQPNGLRGDVARGKPGNRRKAMREAK